MRCCAPTLSIPRPVVSAPKLDYLIGHASPPPYAGRGPSLPEIEQISTRQLYRPPGSNPMHYGRETALPSSHTAPYHAPGILTYIGLRNPDNLL